MISHRSPRRFAAASIGTAALALAAGLAACGSSGSGSSSSVSAQAAPQATGGWASVVAAAEKEGTLTFYSNTTDSGNTAVVAAFEKAYPQIKVNYTRITSATLPTRILQEAASGVNAVDVVTTGVPSIAAGHSSLWKTLTPALLPELSNYPKADARYPWAEKIAENVYAVAYNTSSVTGSEIPTTWKDVISPIFRGQIAYATPVAAPTELGWLQGMNHFYGTGFIQQFGTMKFQVFDSADPAAQAVSAGSDKLAVIVYPGSVTDLISKGAPVKYVVPNPVLVKDNLLLVAAKSPHPAAAQVFANFILSKEGVSIECKAAATAGAIPNVPGCISIPSNAYHVQDLWTPAQETPYYQLLGLKATS